MKPDMYANNKGGTLDGYGTNPAFSFLEDTRDSGYRIGINEKFIFFVGVDFSIRLGKKNDPRLNDYLKHFSFMNDPTMKLKDRVRVASYLFDHYFGHPTLAIQDEGYIDGIYGGWFIKKSDTRLEILLSTGRLKDIKVDENQCKAIEAHIARRFMATLDVTEVLFIDFYDSSLDKYLKDETLDPTKSNQRLYTANELRPENILPLNEIIRPHRRTIRLPEDLNVVAPPASKAMTLRSKM